MEEEIWRPIPDIKNYEASRRPIMGWNFKITWKD